MKIVTCLNPTTRIFLFFYALLFSHFSFGQIRDLQTPDNLSFEFSPSENVFWQMYRPWDLKELVQPSTGLILDNKDFIDGKQSWCIRIRKNQFPTWIKTYINLNRKTTSGKISIYSKTDFPEMAKLKLTCLNLEEKILIKDSVHIANMGDWKQFEIKFLSPEIERLYIEIEVNVTDSLPIPLEGKKLWLDKFQIEIDPEIADDQESIIQVKPNEDDIIDLIKNNIKGYSQIKELKDKNIIALGESVHGSDDMQQQVIETVKYMIEYEDCRLLLFEIDFELGLLIDKYIKKNWIGADLLKRMNSYNFNLERFKDFFNWLQEYNNITNHKVSFCGFDQSFIFTHAGYNHLKDYINELSISQTIKDILVTKINRRQFMDAISQVTQLKQLSNEERKGIVRALELRHKKFNPYPSLLEGDREFIQFQNVKFAIENCAANKTKSLLYAHLGHVDKKNSFVTRYKTPSLGNYLNNYYKENYFVIALLTGEGTLTNTEEKTFKILPLDKPISGSLESQLWNYNCELFYISAVKLNPSYTIRNIGAYFFKQQFYPYNPYNRIDGVLYIRNSKGYDIQAYRTEILNELQKK